jgi:hypothetical protein
VAYAGYDDVDRWITNIAGLGSIGVALLPAKPSVCAAQARTCAAPSVMHLSAAQQAVGDIHLREVVYRACGVAILSCVTLAALSSLLPASVKAGWPLLFILEALAFFAFGVSWFVKGQTLLPILKDRSHSTDSSAIGLEHAQ